MTERKREIAHKNVRRNYRKNNKKLRKKQATLLVEKGNVNTPFTQIFKQNFEI
jgi:hypothetical protein